MIPSAFAESRTLVTTDCSETVDILVYSDDDHLIYASVPKEYAQTYQKQMDSDPTFADKACVCKRSARKGMAFARGGKPEPE